MEKPPSTTEERITYIAQGKGAQDPDSTSQLLEVTFDAPDYLPTLCSYPEPQQYIDGLYEVHYCYSYFVKLSFTWSPSDFLQGGPPGAGAQTMFSGTEEGRSRDWISSFQLQGCLCAQETRCAAKRRRRVLRCLESNIPIWHRLCA